MEALRVISATLERNRPGDALLAADVKRAARERVFGFEILPAPFVVAHLQLGLLLKRLGAPLERAERAGVFLTNALTGWAPPSEPGKQRMAQLELSFPELAREHDAANEVKRDRPILVILGNPPYDGFSGMAMGEERELSEAYRTTKRAPKPQGQGLNELYVRFFRMAERKIVEGTGRGVVCFISNYSWLDGLSHTGMRERYLGVFDRVWIDNLHGDRIISEYAPDGRTSETVFAIQGQSVGIKPGTAIALMARTRSSEKDEAGQLLYRDMHQARAAERREALLASLEDDAGDPYEELAPTLELGLPFKPTAQSVDYLTWPRLPELFPVSFPGVKTSRDDLVVDIDRDRLEERMRRYFDPDVSDEEMSRLCPTAMASQQRFPAREVRRKLVKRGFLPQNIVRYCYRPFDLRWLYWEPETKLLDEKRADYRLHVFAGNSTLITQQKPRRSWSPAQLISSLGCIDLMDRSATCVPRLYRADGENGHLFLDLGNGGAQINLSELGRAQAESLGADPEDLFFHALATLHSPAYRRENQGALRQDWPRVPLPATGERLRASAALGRRLAALLDPEQEAPGVTTGEIRLELRHLAVISVPPGQHLDPERDLAVTAGWGHAGKNGVTMPGKGELRDRPYDGEERAALEAGAEVLGVTAEQMLDLLGETTLDIHVGGKAFWRNVPENVWAYTLGGYPVIKKWLSYREAALLGRPLRIDEVREVTAMARRIAAILLLGPELDDGYEAVKRESRPRDLQ